MCVMYLAYNEHPHFKLIIANNRDEYYRRPTELAHFWKGTNILAGKDLVAGGTWLGVNKSGKFAVITNFRDPKSRIKTPHSRGQITQSYLETASTPKDFLDTITPEKYNPFNLILGNLEQIYYYTNKGHERQQLITGVHGLSNGFLDSDWPKVQNGTKNFKKIIQNNESLNFDSIFELMKDPTKYPLKDLPNTGVNKLYEKALSSIFIKTPFYGTRTTTILAISKDGEILFKERTFDRKTIHDENFSFRIESAQ